jgi:hypothetical protein
MYYRVTVYDGSEVQKVASRMIRIQLYDKDTADLASRDSYMDMLDEPNKMAVLYKRDWQIWQIPDIWNQTQKNSITAHENPEFRSNPADSNYICVKVRNMGCVPSDRNNRVRFYWTLAATGEKWPSDWTSSFINTSAGFQPIGRELPMADSLQVLQPGDSIIVMRAGTRLTLIIMTVWQVAR